MSPKASGLNWVDK